MSCLKINPSVPFCRSIDMAHGVFLLMFVLAVAPNHMAVAGTPISYHGDENGWREYRVALKSRDYVWCGTDDQLLISLNSGGKRLVDVKSGTIKTYNLGGTVIACSKDGRTAYLRGSSSGNIGVYILNLDTGKQRAVLPAKIYGHVQLSYNERYLFFTASGAGTRERNDGLYYLDLRTGESATVYANVKPPMLTTGTSVSPHTKFFTAPAVWNRKSITLPNGDVLKAVAMAAWRPTNHDKKDYLQQDWIDSLVWSPDDSTLLTLNWRTEKHYILGVYELALGKYTERRFSVPGAGYMGARLLAGGDSFYLLADPAVSPSDKGATLYKLDIARHDIVAAPFLSNIWGIAGNIHGVFAYIRISGVKIGQHGAELSNDPSKRAISIYVTDAAQNDFLLRAFPFKSDWQIVHSPSLSPTGRAVAFSRKSKEYEDGTEILVLVKR